MTYTKKSVFTAMCAALCAIFPMMFHAVQNAGNILCPMHIPVLLCGLICGWSFGALCGVAGPILSSLSIGMPSPASLPGMVVELAVYGMVTGLLMRVVRTGKIYADLYISLVAAMILGRIAGGLAKALVFSPEGYSMTVWVSAYFLTALPGIAAQLILIPSLLFALEKSGAVPRRYGH